MEQKFLVRNFRKFAWVSPYALQGWPLFQYSGNFFSTRHWKGPEIQTGIFGRAKSALSLVYIKYTNLIGSLDVVHLLFNSLLTDY